MGRALEHLGVDHIAAYSPQARGRSERAFQTLQDRLTKELALAGIATIEAADAERIGCLPPADRLQVIDALGRHLGGVLSRPI